jgi:hypothetical protein
MSAAGSYEILLFITISTKYRQLSLSLVRWMRSLHWRIVFRWSRVSCEKRLITFVMSVRPHEWARPPLGGLWNLILDPFIKMCREGPGSVQIGQKYRQCTWRPQYVSYCRQLATAEKSNNAEDTLLCYMAKNLLLILLEAILGAQQCVLISLTITMSTTLLHQQWVRERTIIPRPTYIAFIQRQY